MKNRKNITTAAIISALLPLGAFAQAGSTGQQPGAQSPTTPQTSVGTPTSYQGSAGAGEVKKIKEDKLEKKMTAERLIGKDVVDREGNRIGKVKDIGLSAALPSAFSNEQDNQARSSQSAGATSRTSGATSPSVGYPGSGAGASEGYSATSRDAMGGSSSAVGQSNRSGHVHLFVSTDGDRLLQVPASRASFDSDKDELKLDIGRSEIDSATEAGDRLSSRE